jgi:hypothetical protein
MAASKILTFFKDKRDVNIHVEPVPFRADIAVHASEQIRLTESLTIEIFEGGRLVGRHESPPEQPEPESLMNPARSAPSIRSATGSGARTSFSFRGNT